MSLAPTVSGCHCGACPGILFAKLEYPGNVSVAPLWFVSALAYAGREAWLTADRAAMWSGWPSRMPVLRVPSLSPRGLGSRGLRPRGPPR